MKFTSRQIKLLEHGAFWSFIWLFIFDYYYLEDNWGGAIIDTSVEVLTYAAIVYINLLLLIPFFLNRNKQLFYAISILITIMAYVLFLRFSRLENYFYEFEGWRNVFSMVLNTSLFLLISFLYWYFKQWQIEHERQLIYKSEKLEAEINFLRSQISPHFIFNTLNNIYTLALKKDDDTAHMVAKLSTLLRYVLYEGNEGKIFLIKETEILKQYIELQMLRKPLSRNVDFYLEGDTNSWIITPMLLINFVENAFKHSNLDHDQNAWLKINIEIGSDGKLVFSVENNAGTSVSKNETGIGLQNVRRQLELNYPDQHQLNLKNENGIFSIHLTLQLTKG